MRASLARLGFIDDGEVLRGPVPWMTADGGTAQAVVDVALGDGYPFAPPKVRVVEAGAPLELTFHREHDGGLCLWDNTEPVASWMDAQAVVDKVAGWLGQTALGWPGDEDCDLDRYFPPPVDVRLFLVDYAALASVHGCVRVVAGPQPQAMVVEPRPLPTPGRPKRAELRRSEKHMAWVADLGPVTSPMTNWDDVAKALGSDAGTVRRLVLQGSVELLLLTYTRGSQPGMLGLATGRRDGQPTVRVCEVADTSVASRRLRSGVGAPELAERKVAVVGCGAVGSYLADLLFRDGAVNLTLLDGQKLRPGNVVRHIAGNAQVGLSKVNAVKAHLGGTGLDVSTVTTLVAKVTTPTEALELLTGHDVVVDATADERTITLLRWASEQTGQPLVSVCVLREGGIARADRFPVRGDETHLEPVPPRNDLPAQVRERGCGDAVSNTPPSAVVAAAELGTELVLDELSLACTLPVSVLRVLRPQPDAPYDHIGTLTAAPRSSPAGRP